MIGISVGLSPSELENQSRYVEAVLAVSGTPLLLPASHLPAKRLVAALEAVDGLLLAGGGDVHPSYYREEASAELDEVNRTRDEAELAALEWMMSHRRPVLGICRGAQLMAVATGGSLIQDLPTLGHSGHKDPGGGYAARSHPIRTKPGSLVGELLDGLTEVNSHHHQAVRDPGQILVPTAWSEDGIIEALEAPRLLALQWHPEVSAGASNLHQRPFAWLVHGESKWLG
ncbi:gamma-glutamyl-gamma-aminobutyrate hydrolase family protein [Nonomuraea sp. NPDC026600]|uniref:gamma-glutamyl-gamma-aminobutyrate hydrolase family protein n=1 Tax=Nonomuraea sp. NPDC026600 TaxID=3155363 RepID=UPI0033FDAA5E